MRFSAVDALSCAVAAPRTLFRRAGHADFRDRFDGRDGAVPFINIGSDEQAVGKPCGQRGDVVIRHEPALAGRDHQVAQLSGLSAHRRRIRVDQPLAHPKHCGLGRPLLTCDHEDRMRPHGPERRREPADEERPIGFAVSDVPACFRSARPLRDLDRSNMVLCAT
jgi:hypothetical protein